MSLVTAAAVFISDVPEGLSSAACMKRRGAQAGVLFGLWGAIAAASAVSAVATVVGGFSPAVVAAVTLVAAGAILATVADTVVRPSASKRRDPLRSTGRAW